MYKKPALTPPKGSNDGIGNPLLVRFRYPAYPDSELDLLLLSALEGGVDYDIALISCCVITGNTFATGWLATRVRFGDEGRWRFQRFERPDDDILCDREYLFCVGEEQDPATYKYPVIPSFDHWRFPRGAIPFPWKDLRLASYAANRGAYFKGNTAALARDVTCRISGYSDTVEAAHIVPLTHGQWFRTNGMEKYCSLPADPHSISDERNLVTLRRDLRHLLNTRRFTFVAKRFHPQPPAAEAPTVQLVLNIMLPSGSDQLLTLYHNRALQQPLRSVAVEFLFARFAWALLTDGNMPLLSGAAKYNVLLFDPREGRVDEEVLYSSEVYARAKLFFGSYSSSRSVSPRDGDGEDVNSEGNDEEQWSKVSPRDGDDEDASSEGSDEGQWSRGRRRKRSFDSVED